jgi:hypothetical protein
MQLAPRSIFIVVFLTKASASLVLSENGDGMMTMVMARLAPSFGTVERSPVVSIDRAR